MPWRTIEGDEVAPASALELEVLIKGVFEKRRFLDLIRTSSSSRTPGDGALVKKMAGYHQFHAVNAALEETLRASGHAADPSPIAAEERKALPCGRSRASRATSASAWCGTRRARQER